MALTSNKLEQADYTRVVFSVTPELGVGIKEVLDPNYWVHVAARLKPKSRIEVLAEDNSYYAELLVLSADKTWASVALLSYVNLSGDAGVKAEIKKTEHTTVEEGVQDEFSTKLHYVDFVMGQSKGRVILHEGKVVVKEGFPSKKKAAEWMRAHEAELEKQRASAESNLLE
jgi:hypothetical protein